MHEHLISGSQALPPAFLSILQIISHVSESRKKKSAAWLFLNTNTMCVLHPHVCHCVSDCSCSLLHFSWFLFFFWPRNGCVRMRTIQSKCVFIKHVFDFCILIQVLKDFGLLMNSAICIHSAVSPSGLQSEFAKLYPQNAFETKPSDFLGGDFFFLNNLLISQTHNGFDQQMKEILSTKGKSCSVMLWHSCCGFSSVGRTIC